MRYARSQPSRRSLGSILILSLDLMTTAQAAWSITNSKCAIDASLSPSRTSSQLSQLLLVPREAMRTGNECMLEDRGMARRRAADARRDNRCDAGASAIVCTGIAGRRRRPALTSAGRALAPRTETAGCVGDEPPR